MAEREEEEVYREIRREIIRDYYSGSISKEEYESKLEELEERKSGGSGGGGGGFSIFPQRSIWDDLDLPPEQFDFYAPVSFIAIGFIFFVGAYAVYWSRDNPGWRGGANWVVALMALMGVFLILLAVFGLRHWRRKKRSGEYTLHQERYWETHEPPPPPP
jgi:hypothetical protein